MEKPNIKKEISIPRKIAIDTLGGLLILASLLFGWLPGVGGIPLFLAGLGLLATNHEWARRLLKSVKDKGSQFMRTVFRDHPLLVIAYDVVAITLLIVAGFTLFASDGNLMRGVASIIAFAGLGLFIGNRNRIRHIDNFVKRITTSSKKT